MVREDGKRNFALREDDGSEPSEFSGSMPRQAALKAARTLDPAPAEDEAERTTLRLREKGTQKIHEYEGWAWKDMKPHDVAAALRRGYMCTSHRIVCEAPRGMGPPTGRHHGRSTRSDGVKCLTLFERNATIQANTARTRAVQLGPTSTDLNGFDGFIPITIQRSGPQTHEDFTPALRRKRKSDVSLGSSVTSGSPVSLNTR